MTITSWRQGLPPQSHTSRLDNHRHSPGRVRRWVVAAGAGTSILSMSGCQTGLPSPPSAIGEAPASLTSVVDCVNALPLQPRLLGSAVEVRRALAADPTLPCQDATDQAILSTSRQLLRQTLDGARVDDYLTAHQTTIQVVSPERMKELAPSAAAFVSDGKITISRRSLEDPRHLAVILAHEGTHVFDGTEQVFQGGATTQPLRESLGLNYPPNPEVSGPNGDWLMATEAHASFVAAAVAQDMGYEEQTDGFHPDGRPRTWDETLAASRANPGIRKRVGLSSPFEEPPPRVDLTVEGPSCLTIPLDGRILSEVGQKIAGARVSSPSVATPFGLLRHRHALCTWLQGEVGAEQARTLLSHSETGQHALEVLDSAGLEVTAVDDVAFQSQFGNRDSVTVEGHVYFPTRLLQNLEQLAARLVYEATLQEAGVPAEWPMPAVPSDLPKGLEAFQTFFQHHAYAQMKAQETLAPLSGTTLALSWEQIANHTWHDETLRTFVGLPE